MDTIFDRIKQANHLNDNDDVIIQYIINHLEEIPHLSSGELARRTYTSSTSIIRFIKKLKYQSYNDFKLHIVSDLKNIKNPTLSVMPNEDMLSLVNKISKIEINIIQKTKELLSMEVLTQVMAYISKHQYIDIIANDTNASIGDYASHLLWSVGKFVQVYHHSDKQLYVGLNTPQDHVVIFISKKGNNAHLKKIAKILKVRGVKTILLTSNLDEGLAQYCDYCLYGLMEQTSAQLRDSVFYMSIKYILDLIYVILFSQNYENTIQLEQIYKDIYEN
ncbi:MAG: MurR/RpiR family transcriptional regulator [Erysipelotrichales bacterium]|nr:MurR/RpiR family transcriptional regulator [Erysipelotrichales bacterium]